jgi:hypothetical protein
MSEDLPPPRQLAELIPPGCYRTPTAILAGDVRMGGIEGPPRILLTLEGGYELEIPATRDAIDRLFRGLRSMTTQR